MATATSFQTAAQYSPISGLLGRSTPGAGAGLGGGYSPVSFVNPNAPTTQSGAGAGGPAQSITGAGSYTPDWASLINNDAGLKDAQAALAAGGAQNQSQLFSQLANAYESFGANTDLAKLAQQLGMSQADIQNALGPDVQKLAQENTDAGLSTKARLDQANQTAQRQLLASLNKRGLLHSGETGYQLDQQNLGYRQAQSDAYQKFLGYLQQYQQGYLSAQQSNAQSLAGAYGSAADRVVQNNHGSAGGTAQLDHIDANGQAVYKAPDGNLYNADGSVYTQPQNPAALAVGMPDTYTPYGPGRSVIGRVAA